MIELPCIFLTVFFLLTPEEYIHLPSFWASQVRQPKVFSLANWVYHLNGDDDDCFYIALFSALEQTHCARMWFYMSD